MIKEIEPKGFFKLLISLLLILFILFLLVFNQNSKLDNLFLKQNYDYSWIESSSTKMYNKSLNNLSFGEFQYLITKIYVYEKQTKDCKYWSYFYYNYFKNKGFEVKYVLSETHLFVVLYVNNAYWILDQKVFLKVNLK